MRSRILGDGGRAKEAQTEFLTLIEDTIRKPDLSKSKSSGTWLVLSNMVINNSNAVGYNSQLRQVTPVMKFGVNNGVNKDTKKIKHSLYGRGKIRYKLTKQPPGIQPSSQKAIEDYKFAKPTEKKSQKN